MEIRWSYPFSHIVASISVEWKRVVKRFLINWMQWEIYRVVFGAIPLLVSHKMHYLVLWLRTIGANCKDKNPLPTLRTCHINSYHEGFCAILSVILSAPDPLTPHSTCTLQAHLGLLFSNIKFSNAQVMRRAIFGQLQPLFPFVLGYPFFIPFFQNWPPHFRAFDPNFAKENLKKAKNATRHLVIWDGLNGQIAVQSAASEAALGSLYVRKKGMVRFFLAKK